jgi:hypothetical protein
MLSTGLSVLSVGVSILVALLGLYAQPPSEPEDIQALIETCAHVYGADSALLQEIVRLESAFDPEAVGDHGRALGLWQWHKPSIELVLEDMDWDWDWEEDGDPRANVYVSTIAACHAIENMDLGRWWSTHAPALKNLGR